MSKFLSEVKGFTPVIDVLAQELGLMTATVYGIVWRYCQMENKTCSASRETIAKHAGISIKSAQRHLQKLCKAGYLKDLTPERKHRPHIYADTGKAKIIGLLTVEVGGSESPTSQSGEPESLTGRSESPTGVVRKSNQGGSESLIRIPSYDSNEETTQDTLKLPTKPDALRMDLSRITEQAQNREGNWAEPAAAGGSSPWTTMPVDAFCIFVAGINPELLPDDERDGWAQYLCEIAKRWTTKNRPITPEIMTRAIQNVPDSDIGWKTYTSPFAGNFATDIGPLLLDGGQKGTQREKRQRVHNDRPSRTPEQWRDPTPS